MYRFGGYQTICEGIINVILDIVMCKRLNEDLEKVLNALWVYVCEAVNLNQLWRLHE